MEERDQWEEMAQRNKRRRLNNFSSSNLLDDTSNIHEANININTELSSDDDSSSVSTEFEAISFENIEQLNAGNGQLPNQDLSLSSSEDENENGNDENTNSNTNTNTSTSSSSDLLLIPKKGQHTRSHLDLIKAVRKSYRISKELPILEDFIEKQGITRKRAKRAIRQVMRENNLDPTKLRKRENKPGDDDDDDAEGDDGEIETEEATAASASESGSGTATATATATATGTGSKSISKSKPKSGHAKIGTEIKSALVIQKDGQRKLKRFEDSSEDDSDDDIDMTEQQQKRQLKLLNLPKNAGRYPFDSAVEKAMFALLNRLKQLKCYFCFVRFGVFVSDI